MAGERRIAVEEREIRVEPTHVTGDGASLKTLFRRLTDEASDLVRQEVMLAKLEMKEELGALAKDAVKLGIAASLAAAGGLALTAFLILVIGVLLDGAYWAGALIVGAFFLLVGGALTMSAMNDLKKRELKPDETIESLKRDKRWAKHEAREFKREMMS